MRIKPILKFPDYAISDTGIIYSKAKRANRPKPKEYRPLKTWLVRGYPSIMLQIKKKIYKKYISRIVLETFVGRCPKGWQCRHLDGNPLNNNLNNLKWGTRSENQMDRLRHGTDHRGEKHGMSKLKKEDVFEIRKLAYENLKTFQSRRKKDLGSGYKKIAKKFGVLPSTIGHVVRRSTWGWLKDTETLA